MIHAGVGLGKNLTNHRLAAQDATREALESIPVVKPDIAFVFASIVYTQEDVLAGVVDMLPPGVPVLGGSSAGEITSVATVFDAVVVLIVASDSVQFTPAYSKGVAKDSFGAGATLAESIKKKSPSDPQLLISIPDGITGDGSAIIAGFQSVLGADFPIIGGSSGDDYQFKKTFEYFNGKVLTDSIVGVGISGKFSYGFGIRHGWEPVGLPMRVTRATGTLLQEVDHRPALEIYQKYFGREAMELIREPLARMTYTYPLGLAVEGSDELLIRDPLFANQKGEITMAAAIPEGAMIRLMVGDRERALEATKIAAHTALEALEGATPRLIFVFNCMARNKLLGIRCNEENQIVQDAIGRGVPMFGFYTYGEQGPLLGKKNTPAYFHNETMTLLVLGE